MRPVVTVPPFQKFRLSEHLEHSPFPLGKPPPINTSAPFPAEQLLEQLRLGCPPL
jgi:hypothetical protein